MSDVVLIELFCDFPDCEAGFAGEGRMTWTRADARSEGWRTHPGGFDYCPAHASKTQRTAPAPKVEVEP